MSSPFKMNPKSPFMKALVGKQGNLPQHLQDAIKAAPESPAKSYGKSPMKKTDPNKKETEAQRRERLSVGKKGNDRGAGGQRTFAEGKVKANVGKERGATDLAVEIPKAYNKAKKYIKSKLGMDDSPAKMTGGKKGIGKAPNAKMQARVKSVGKQGRPGTGVRKESKPLTPAQQKNVDAQNARAKANAKRTGRGTGLIQDPTITKKKSNKKGSPVKSTGGKRKLGTEGMTYKEKVAYYEKQKKAKAAKNPKIRMGMGTSYTTIKK